MSAFDLVFSILMALSAVLVFLKQRRLITWDWSIVLAPAVIAFLIKIHFIFVAISETLKSRNSTESDEYRV
jgi:hypothetical protein